MATKKLQRKHMKEDRLVTTTLRVSQLVQQHLAKVVSGVVILAVLVGVALFTSHARRGSAQEAEKEFAAAMNQFQVATTKEGAVAAFGAIADRYSGHGLGVLASYFVGESQLELGRHSEALAAYERYLSKAGDDAPFREAATIGKALCYEGLGDYRTAAQVLDDLLSKMDEKDPRHGDVLFQAALFYEKAGERARALELYQRVIDTAAGSLKDRATVRVAVLE